MKNKLQLLTKIQSLWKRILRFFGIFPCTGKSRKKVKTCRHRLACENINKGRAFLVGGRSRGPNAAISVDDDCYEATPVFLVEKKVNAVKIFLDKCNVALVYLASHNTIGKSAIEQKLAKLLWDLPYGKVSCSDIESLTELFIDDATSRGYQPAQDYLAELKFTTPLTEGDEKSKKCRLEALSQYVDHLKKGRELGMSEEEIITHDEIYGLFMNYFEQTVMQAARRIAKFIAVEMPQHVKEYDVKAELYGQPEEVKCEVGKGLKRVAEFIRNLRDDEFDEGWLKDDSISFSYLMAHAERIAVKSAKKRR